MQCEELTNEEKEKEKRTDGGQLVNQEVKKFSKERVRAAMQSVKVVQMIYLWRYEDIEGKEEDHRGFMEIV